ncbi:bactofilin family protein [Sorangium atrum]|uniref:Polymer-forming cytoskeletal protein n=1 Tax=Sorangium atrum TaxID=2995308 RepID=A0ABT5C282_9BACT|nr:polymer-forming cytoskeletal protein [Sorangium aterium]MDC0680525.1 polymer-forming cytoskeletal protein [Sorangium aterium]
MAAQSSIGPTTAIRGNVQGDGDLEILGRVEGSVVMTGDVTIGEGALIQSDVRGRRVVVRGAVAGNISGDEAVILEPGARVVGDLGAPQIGIHAGALVRGNVTTGAPLAAAPAPAPARAAAAAPAPRAAAARPARAPAEQRAPAPPARPAPRAAPAPARPAPAARPAPVVEARPAPAPEPRLAAVHDDEEADLSASAAGEGDEPDAAESTGGPPPPVVPALRKGAAKASLRKRGGR